MAGPSEEPRALLYRALDEHGDRLYAFALRMTRDPDLAADAVQEAFTTALRKFDTFRGESNVLAVTVSTVNRWENAHAEPSKLAWKAIQDLARKRGLPDDVVRSALEN